MHYRTKRSLTASLYESTVRNGLPQPTAFLVCFLTTLSPIFMVSAVAINTILPTPHPEIVAYRTMLHGSMICQSSCVRGVKYHSDYGTWQLTDTRYQPSTSTLRSATRHQASSQSTLLRVASELRQSTVEKSSTRLLHSRCIGKCPRRGRTGHGSAVW